MKMKCCHNQDKEKEKNIIHYEKLGEFQDDHNEENDKLINLAVMLNALENKVMKNKIKRNLRTDFRRVIPLRQIKMTCGEDENKKNYFQ